MMMTLTVGSVSSKAMDNSKSMVHQVVNKVKQIAGIFCRESMGKICQL
jgi:hypothetical protein